MSKSLQKGIIFAVCIALVCALGVTLFIFDGTGGAVTGQEGQASNVAQNKNTTTYTHGSYIERDVPSGVRQVNSGTDFVDAVSKDQDISITGSFELTSSQSFLKKDNNGKISDDPATSGTALVYSGTIYGNGYNITITGSQAITNNTAAWDCGPNGYADAANIYGGLVGKLTGQIYDLNVTMKSGTMEKIKGNDGGDRWLDVGVIAGIVDDTNARIENCSVTIPANTQITALKSPISNPGLWGSSAGTQYVRAAGIAAELNNGTIVNCTVTNNGCISAGLQKNKDDNSITNGYYGAAANAVAWVNNGTLNNIIVKGSGQLIGLKTAAISVVNNSNNSPTTNAYNGYTGTYDFRNGGDGGNWSTASMYESGARQTIANFYQASDATTRGGTNKDQTDYELANSGTTLTVNPSTYTIYFDPTKSSDDTRLAVLFNNENYSAGAEYELYGASTSSQISNAQISGANGKVLARNLPATPSTWNSGGTFTATLNSELLFNPDTYENPLDRYEHGYTEGQTTSSGRAISTGDEWEDIFAPSASGTPSGTYYLTNNIVINGFTGKSMSGVTIDGNGKTIFVIGTTQSSYSGSYVGGLVGDFTGGTIKNVRVVYLSLAGEISFTMSTERGGRVGLLAGRITNSTIENVQVCVDEGVTVNATASSDTQFAMGGLIGEAATGSNITGATVDLNGELNPSGKWQFLGGIVGVVQSANTSGTSATVKMENIIIRGAGTLSGNALNDNQPTFTAAVAVLMPTTGAVPAVPFVTIDGLIYDFNVKLNGQLNGTGGTGNQYACYYLFTYNYNDYRSDGWQTGSPISEYNKAVSYSNVFVNSAYIKELEGDENGPGYAQQRTNGNAAVGGAVINTVQNKVEGLENPVAAYFNPVDGADDMIFRASGTWDSDKMVILTLSNGTVRKSVLETAGVNTSAKLVYAPKTLAATANVVQLSLYENVDWPTAPAALTYSGEEQSFAFTLQTVSGTPVESSDYTVTYSVKEGNTGVLGENNLPLNAGTYTATITLTNGMEFIDDGQGTTSSEYSLTVEVQKKELSITSSATEEDPYKPHISAVYGATGDKAAVQGLLTWNTIGSYITGNYNGEEVSFTIDKIYIAATDEISGEFTLAGAEEVADENIASLDANSYLITVTEDSGNYTVAEGQFFVYGVTPATLTVTGVTFEGGFDGVYDGQAHNVAVQYSGLVGSDVAYNFNITVTGVDGIAVTNAGDYTVTVAADEYNPNYDVTYEGMNEYTVTVEKADYDMTGVTFENASFEYDGTEKTITVSGTLPTGADGIQVTVSYSGTNGTALTNAGSTEITATFATTSTNYNVPEATKTATLTVTPVTLTINEISGNYTDYTAADIVIDDMVSGILEGDTEGVTVTPAWDTPLADENGYLAAGTYNATLSLSGDKSANYTFGSDNIATVTVDQFDLSGAHITITSEQFTYDGNEKTVTYTVLTAEGGKDITALLTAEGDKQTNANAENAKYTVTLSGDDNFTGTARADWSIDQKTLTISPFTADFLDYESSGSLYNHLTNKDSGLITGVIDGDTITFSGVWATTPATAEGTSYVAAGSYTLNMNAPGNANYKFENNAMSVTINALDIGGAEVAVTWNGSGLTYTAEEQSVTLASVTVNGVALPVDWFNLANNKGTDAKTYTANIAANNPNITGSTDKEFTIAPYSVTFAWSVSGEIVEGMAVEDVKSLAKETNNGGILEADTYTFGVDIGDYTEETPRGTQVTFTPSVTFTEEGDAANYNITFDPVTEQLTVQLGEVEIAVTQATVNKDYVNGYTLAADFLENFTTSDVTIDESEFSVTVTPKDGSDAVGFGSLLDVGEYTVTLTSSVYNLTGTTTYTYQVTATVAEISWAADTNLIYNGAKHTLTATVTNKVESDEVNVTVSLTEVTDNVNVTAEGFTFTATGLTGAAAGNYTLDGASNLTSGVKTITPAALNITQTAEETLTRPYDGTTTEATSFLTEKYVTITGGVSGENIYGMLNAEIADGGEIKNAGVYTITVTFNAEAEGAGNYSVGDFTSLEIGYTVTAKTITVTFGGYEDLTYNGQARTLTATADFVSGENIDLDSLIAYTGDVTDGRAVNAGSYTATITKAQIEDGNANYTLAEESATQEFTISPATLTLTQADGAQLSRVYDGTVTEAGAFVSETYFTVSGYVDGGDVYALFTAAADGGAVILNADSYTINITINSGAEGADNYTCETFAISYEVTPIQWTASVAAPEGGLTYDGTNKLGSLVITGDNEGTGLEGAPEIAATVTGGSMVNAGTYTVTLQLQTAEDAVYEGGNFILDAESAEIVIAKRVVEIRWDEASDLTYNGLAHTLTATVANKVGQDEVNATVQLSGDNVKVTESGFTYTVTGLEGTAAENYTIDGAGNLTSKTQYISRATLTVQFEGITGLEYTGAAHTVTATATGWQNSENYDSTLNRLITIGGADTQVLNAGDYTATITVAALEAALGNYTLAQDASENFTVAPAPLNVSVAIAGDGVADNKLTWNVEAEVTVSGNSKEGWTLTSGGTSYTVTVTGADGVASDVLQLTLNGSEYKGTPYGTRVQNGELAVASTDPNYKVEVTPVDISIEPDISIEINTGAEYPVSAVYSKDVTYTAEGFANYFRIDGQPEGDWAYSVEGVESGSFSNVGTYTVKATFTITASGIKLENHFTFTITQATVTGVVLNGEGAYTYGELKAGDSVFVKVTYSDGYTATVNAEFTADMSTGGYVIAGESVELTLTGDDGANANYAQVDGQTVTVSVSKAGITAAISYMDNSAVEGVLTLPYIGKAGYSHNITVTLNGVLGGDVVEGELETEIINAKTYGNLTFALHGDDSYEITNAAALSVVVTPAEITVVWDNYDGLTYDGTAKAPTATAEGTFDSDEVTLTVTVAGDNATDTDGTMTAVNAGDYTATVAAFVQGNYKLSADSVQSFSIAKASATLNIDDYNTIMGSTYTGSAVTITPTINGEEDTQGIVAVSITDEAVAPVQEIVNAGKYNVTLSITDNMNYEDASESFEVKVSPASLDVTTANTSFEYGDTIDLGASVTALGDDDVTVAIESVTVDNEAAELKNVGTYTVTYKLEGEDSGNYSITAGGSVTVTITAKELTITWSDETFTYNGSAQAPDYSADFIEGEEIELTVTITGNNASEGQAINAGDYTATISEFEQGNYKLTSNSAKTFTIGKANLTLTPPEVSFSNLNEEMMDKYSENNYEATIKADVTVTGVGNDGKFNDFTIDTSAIFTEGKLAVGDYTFTISVASGNYNDATFTVKVTEQQVVTLTATPSSDVYTGSPITFTFGNEVLPDGIEITYTVQKDGNPVESVLDAGNYTVTFTVNGNSADNDKWYEVSEWTGTISPATVTANDVSAVYGEVFTAAATGEALQHVGGWQIVTFNGVTVEVKVTETDSAASSAARAGEEYLGAGGYKINIQLVSPNFTFGTSAVQTKNLTVARKQLELAPELPSDLTYSSDGIVIGTPDHASQLVGGDAVEVTMLIDGQPYVAGETVLSAGVHTVTFEITDASGNYGVAETSSSTFTVAKKSVTPSINVAGDKVENNSTLEMDKGENVRVQTAIDNFIADNGIKEGEYTLSVKDASGTDKKLNEIAAWAPGTYTVTVALGDNYDGSLTFSIVVKEGTTAQIPEPPTLPSTPLEDSGSSLSTTDWLFPLIIAVECLVAAVLVAAIVIAAIKRSK